jgi:hypothetical protein
MMLPHVTMAQELVGLFPMGVVERTHDLVQIDKPAADPAVALCQCTVCGVSVAERNLNRHLRRQHKNTKLNRVIH